jgi:arylsulfatase A-like enzyme
MNVVFIIGDDWRWDTLSCAGNPVVTTPHLDALAANGVRFTQARVTTSICGVSRATMLTGQWMSRHGNKGFARFDTPWTQTYPGIMREAGASSSPTPEPPPPAERGDRGASFPPKPTQPVALE